MIAQLAIERENNKGVYAFKKLEPLSCLNQMRTKGPEPSHLAVLEPKSSASANSATSASAAFAIIAKTLSFMRARQKIAIANLKIGARDWWLGARGKNFSFPRCEL